MKPKSFKEFYTINQEPIQTIKWNVILFTGDYNPISRDEYDRITCFVEHYAKPNAHIFNEHADIGLLTPNTSLSTVNTKIKYNLTFEERQFITGKLFGFKMFPIDFTEMLSLAHFDKEKTLEAKVNEAVKYLKEQFDNCNILIVLRPNEGKSEEDKKEVINVFSENNMNIGFITYTHIPSKRNEHFSKIPITGDNLKACCLLDAERPDALSLKSFAYKYSLQNSLDAIKTMHFLTKNEKYDLVFRQLFPEIRLHERENEEQEYNTRTIMEIIKKMYLSKT